MSNNNKRREDSFWAKKDDLFGSSLKSSFFFFFSSNYEKTDEQLLKFCHTKQLHNFVYFVILCVDRRNNKTKLCRRHQNCTFSLKLVGK